MSILAADKREWAAIELPFSSVITAFISEPKSAFSNYFDNPALKTKGRETSQWRAVSFLAASSRRREWSRIVAARKDPDVQ
jgi:hypothetical protein